MKYKMVMAIMLAVLFTLTGCTWFKVVTTDPMIIEKGKAIGVLVATYYPVEAQQSLPYARGLAQAAADGSLSLDQFNVALANLIKACPNKEIQVAVSAAIILLPGVEIQLGTPSPKVAAFVLAYVDGVNLVIPQPVQKRWWK